MALLVPPPLKRAAIGNKRKFQGIAFVLVILLMFWFVIISYNRLYIKTVPVTLRTDRIGNQLNLNADVKFRGVIVGQVKVLSTKGVNATLGLAMKPDQLKLVPANVQARILPKTLFGQKYVELVSPDNVGPNVPALSKGAVIPQDRTTVAIEIEQLYDNLLPFITTVQPDKLNSTLSAIATALDGRGEELGDNLVRLDDYLRQLNQHIPSIQEDFTGLANEADILNRAAPDLLRFLDNDVVTSRTLVQKQNTLFATLTGTANAADTGSALLSENRNRLIQAPAVGVPVTRTIARRANNLPLVVNGLAGLVPKIHDVFGGSPENRNWLHISLTILGQKGPYTRADCPKYLSPEGNQFGPNCTGASSSSSGASVGDGTATPVDPSTATDAPSADASSTSPVGGVRGAVPEDGIGAAGPTTADLAGDMSTVTVDSVGSPDEKAMIQQIVGSVNADQVATHDMEPDVADLILGPMLRGTEVNFQ